MMLAQHDGSSMDRRTTRRTVWAMIGTIAGAIVSAAGIRYFPFPSTQQPWASVFEYATVFIALGALGVFPGLAAGFLAGNYAAPLRHLAPRIVLATLIGALVGWVYGLLLAGTFEPNSSPGALPLFALKAGAVGGFLIPVWMELVLRRIIASIRRKRAES